MSIGNELIGKTIAYARVNGYEVMLVFEDGTTFDYTASDGGYSSYELISEEEDMIERG